MRIILIFVGVLLALLVLTYGALAWRHGREGALEKLLGPIERNPIEFPHLPLTSKPNQYLVCPKELCTAVAHREAGVYEVSASELHRAWDEFVTRQPGVTFLGGDDQSGYYDYEVRTPLLRFPDTVTVWFIPISTTRSTLAVYSRSHYGYSDGGANKRRVDAWLAELDGLVPRLEEKTTEMPGGDATAQ